MVRKRKKVEVEKPWCFYCDRVFNDENDLIVHQKHKHFKCLFCPKRLSSSKALNVHSVQVHKKPITEIPESKPGREDPKWEIFGSTGIPPGMKRGGDPPAQLGPVPNQAMRPGFPAGPYRPGPMVHPLAAGPTGMGRVPPVAAPGVGGGPYPVVRPPAYGVRPGPAAGPPGQQFNIPGAHRPGMPYARPPGGFPPPDRPGQPPYPYQPGGVYAQPYRPSQVAAGPARTTYSARPTIISALPTAGASGSSGAAADSNIQHAGMKPGGASG
eukprot:jgi/Picsp_1/4059/NSC_01570-R1_zinc finger protein